MRPWAGILLFVLLFLSCEFETKRLEQYAVQGIDVSHHQSNINWEKVAEQNVKFAFIKATEGGNHIDTLFCKNWLNTRENNITRGAYHFYRPNVDPITQAKNFTEIVEMEAGDLPPVLDIETTDKVPSHKLVRDLNIWLGYVEAHFGIRPIIYSNMKFYHEYLANHFKNHPFWIARYHRNQPYMAKGKEWHFWQYGDHGKLEGIEGYVDFNVFYQDEIALENLCLSEPNHLTWLARNCY